MPDERRWTIHVCERHDYKDCLEGGCRGDLRQIEVVPAAEADRLRAERDEWKAYAEGGSESAEGLIEKAQVRAETHWQMAVKATERADRLQDERDEARVIAMRLVLRLPEKPTQLRKMGGQLLAALGPLLGPPGIPAEADRLRAEAEFNDKVAKEAEEANATLLAERDEARHRYETEAPRCDVCGGLRAEPRLGRTGQICLSPIHSDPLAECEEALRQAEIEIDRLRAALQEIAEDLNHAYCSPHPPEYSTTLIHLRDAARAALDPEGEG